MANHITREGIQGCLKELLIEIAHIDGDAITPTATIDGDLRMESVQFVEIQVALEDEYEIQLDPIEIVERNEFRLIVDYIYGLATAET